MVYFTVSHLQISKSQLIPPPNQLFLLNHKGVNNCKKTNKHTIILYASDSQMHTEFWRYLHRSSVAFLGTV